MALAAREKLPPILAAKHFGMCRGSLEIGFAWEVDEEVECRLESEPSLQYAGNVVGGLDERGRQRMEDAERRDMVQEEDTCPNEDVVPDRRPDHGDSSQR